MNHAQPSDAQDNDDGEALPFVLPPGSDEAENYPPQRPSPMASKGQSSCIALFFKKYKHLLVGIFVGIISVIISGFLLESVTF